VYLKTKIFAEHLEETTKNRRKPILILCALIITYCILKISLLLGEYALFVGGAIVGGLWGEIWSSIFGKKSPMEKMLSLNYLPYILVFIFLVVVLGYLIMFYPL
jgi:hypothetical protein